MLYYSTLKYLYHDWDEYNIIYYNHVVSFQQSFISNSYFKWKIYTAPYKSINKIKTWRFKYTNMYCIYIYTIYTTEPIVNLKKNAYIYYIMCIWNHSMKSFFYCTYVWKKISKFLYGPYYAILYTHTVHNIIL